MPESFLNQPGTSPILVSMPHNGSFIPPGIAQTMTDDGRSSRDTDWFLDRLYQFPELDSATTLIANFSRYVIDLNRSSDDVSLYPGQTTTGLIPDVCFDGSPIYQDKLPDAPEVARRVREIWQPYHEHLAGELGRIKEQHGFVVLIEAHSIASQVPRFFEGELPDFNLGTNSGQSCDPGLSDALLGVLDDQTDYSHVINGRFLGGFLTRHFGQPEDGVHAVQIELSQATYLNEWNREWDEEKAPKVQAIFQQLIHRINQWISTQ